MKEQRIKNQIRRLRFDANEMTQAELAEKANVTRQCVEGYKQKPPLESINHQSGYETHALSSILTWLEDE